MRSIWEVTSAVALCATLAGFLGLSASTEVRAAAPACSCWDETTTFTSAFAVFNAVVLETGGVLGSCTTFPQSPVMRREISARVTGVDDDTKIFVFEIGGSVDPTDAAGDLSGNNCSIFVTLGPGDELNLFKTNLPPLEAWTCIRDVTQLCRDIGG